jgi:hypothetical protein
VSPLLLAAEHYRTAATRQHLDAALARYRQKWIIEPEALDPDEKYELILYAKAAVNEIVLHHPDREQGLSQLKLLIENLQPEFSEEKWETFRRELLRVLPDLDDPRESAPRFEPEPPEVGDRDRWLIGADDFALGLEEKGSGE